ncbi:PREDICTED: protein bric-a-brac 1-like isoform X2 [Nicrophorus vespilloides]|uniref:Protein bric-a-brac 1-like isoform X2 n=1 Tax=Nicrophorus vespilloides TaxID=110193 RepID=A0ABM1MW96_NICVS|nr:PREDICTED: protein bric-a-brac 1-like isoform X2 [Nicrophorus vespilloides]
MDSQQFSLCWDNFHVNMSSGMHSLLEKEDLVDVTLAIEGQYLKAHKMVLSVCSPYFRKLFSTNPCKHPIFFMKDVTYEVMNDLLTFMYQGEVQVNQENLATFIKTAEALQIKGLTGENREVDDALKEVNSLKRPPPFPDEPRNRLNRSKPISAKKIKTTQETQDLQRDESYIEQTSDSMQLKVEPNEQVEDAESYGWPDDSYLNETENLPDDSQVDEAEECHMMEEEPKPGTSLEGAIPNQGPKKRRTITFQEKIRIIQRAEKGVPLATIGRSLGLSRSTINTIVKDKDRIMKHLKGGLNVLKTSAIRKRSCIMEEMERLLLVWLSEEEQRNVCPAVIQEKAKQIHEDLKNSMEDGPDDEVFIASSGWFRRFKVRSKLQTIDGEIEIPKDCIEIKIEDLSV